MWWPRVTDPKRRYLRILFRFTLNLILPILDLLEHDLTQICFLQTVSF